jgi:hypothetical protein
MTSISMSFSRYFKIISGRIRLIPLSGADIEPGYYQLRVVSEGGISLPVVIGVARHRG